MFCDMIGTLQHISFRHFTAPIVKLHSTFFKPMPRLMRTLTDRLGETMTGRDLMFCMPLCGLLLQCARDNLGAFSIHFDVVDPLKVYRAAGGPGSDSFASPGQHKSDRVLCKMDLGVAKNRPV